jgi:hypothetical protein
MMLVPLAIVGFVVAFYFPSCVTPPVLPAADSAGPRMEELWEAPADLQSRDLFYGPWGPERAPDPGALYTFLAPKRGGVNPGMSVRDPGGREWRIKQPPVTDRAAEGPVEVVLSRVLSAVGYHQPPVYFLPAFTLAKDGAVVRTIGGRFRLDESSLRDAGEWSWQRNPFVDTTPYQGLLVILLMFNSSDLKNSNNTLYDVSLPSQPPGRWFVVRDLGTALGDTGRLAPHRNDPDRFERHGFIRGVRNGFVEFEYGGYHQELVRNRITVADVQWASELLAGLTDTQWIEAFRAGGYDPPVADRFIRVLQRKIRQGRFPDTDGGSGS